MTKRAVALICALTAVCVTPARSAAVVTAASFLDSVGVASHVTYTDGSYASLPNVVGFLNYLGFRYMRDSAPSNDAESSRFSTLMKSGVRFTFMVNRDQNQQLTRLSALAKQFPGSIVAVEGPNEVNNQPVSFAGVIGTQGAQAYQKALYAAVKSDINLRDVPVLNFTDYPDREGVADAGNFHSYQKGGSEPQNTLWYDRTNQLKVMTSLPVFCTETGYYTAVSGVDGVNEISQAQYLVQTLAYNASAGVVRTHLYELADEKADSGSNTEMHYGLFRADLTPKPAAVFIHNLTHFLSDAGPSAHAFTPKPFTVSFSNPDVKQLLVAKSDGSYVLLFWMQRSPWGNRKAIALPPVALTWKMSAVRSMTGLHLADGTTKDYGRGSGSGGTFAYVSGVVAVAISPT